MVETELKYSVWFKPEPEEERAFLDLVVELATQYHAPLFVPHVTLAPDLSGPLPEVLAQTEALAAQLSPFDIEFNEVGVGETYFQCVFLKAVSNPELIQARQLAAQAFHQPQLAELFMPHLSLLYGTFDATVKATAREWVASRLNSMRFTVRNLAVFTAQADPSLWQEVGTITMKVRE